MEPGPAFVLIQGTDSEEFLGEGGFSHIPDLLSNPPRGPHARLPQEGPHYADSRAQGRRPAQLFCL